MGSPGGKEGEPLVRAERTGGRLTLTLDSPHNRNALSGAVLDELAAALDGARTDQSLRCVVLTGAGEVFSSGADLRERLAGGAEASRGGLDAMGRVLRALVWSPQPVVARVNGHARAGALGLIAACDLAAGPPWATFGLSEVRVGVAPAIIAGPLLRVMDRRAFLRLALTGEPFTAAQAAGAGLLTSVAEDLDGWVEEQVASIERGAPGALAATRSLPERLGGFGLDEALADAARLSEELFAGPEAKEGMAAFLEKRDASWRAPR